MLFRQVNNILECMKLNINSKSIYYIALLILFIFIRLNFIANSGGLIDIEFKTIAIANSSFPFGIIKNSSIQDFFMPVYYFILHFVILISKNEIFLRAFNSIIAFINILVLIRIGKKLINENFGLFLGFIFAINKFFLFYTSLISPYCLSFLAGTILINCLIDYLKRPSQKTAKYLVITNCVYMFCDVLGFIFVGAELGILYLTSQKKEVFKRYFPKLAYETVIGFFWSLPFLAVHYFVYIKYLIPPSTQAVGFNLNGLYLMINEYISPYLSFMAPENQTKNTLGMLYTFFLNPDFRNVNSFKIFLTLFYSSILPLFFLIYYSLKTISKNYKLKTLFTIASLYLAVIVFAFIYEFIDLNPVCALQFYLIVIIAFCRGLFFVKDKVIKYILIFCFLAIQIINPNVNTLNVTIAKEFPVNKSVDIFFKEYDVNSEDFIIMPYLGEFGKTYYKKLTFFDFDYSILKKNGKKSFIKQIASKKAKTVNKNNIKYLLEDYMFQKNVNDYITKYFVENCLDKTQSGDRIILVIDKLNSKPISKNAILKFGEEEKYKPGYKKIKFKKNMTAQNQAKQLYDAVSSKTIYNFISLLNESFLIADIVEYKKIDNEYYKLSTNSQNIISSIHSNESDYAFIIFKRP